MFKQLQTKFLALLAIMLMGGSYAWAEEATLSNANIVAAGSANNSYATYSITDGNGKTWNAYAIKNQHSKATSDYHYLQIKKYASNTAYYLQVPEYGTKITSITMTVSGSSQPMTGGGNSATLFFSSSNSTSAAGTGVASGTGASSVTIDCSSLNLNTGYITASGAVRIWDVTITYEGGSTSPVITANDVNIAYDATSGAITYTVNNGVDGGVVTANTTSDWLTLGTVGENVPFTCASNSETTARTATVTLTYTYGEETVTKDITVTQAGNPNVVNNISDITAVNENYSIRGTIVAKSNRGLVIGDGTGYVYYYNQNYSQSDYNVGDMVKMSGTMGSYNHVYQFTSTATIETSETSNYNNTPAVQVLDATAIAAYSENLHLSDYVQLEGTLVKSGNYYNLQVEGLETDASISYPTTEQAEELDALENEIVIVKGYFGGVSSNHFNVILESIEEKALLDNAINGLEDAYTIDMTQDEYDLTFNATATSGADVLYEVIAESTTIPSDGYEFEDGYLMVSKKGTIVIRAYVEADDEYKAAEKTVNVTVVGEKDDAVIVVEDANVAYGSSYTIDSSMIEGGDITVTSSNASVATVDGLVITPAAVGSTTITVATAENEDYKAGSETFTLTVTAPEGKSTAPVTEDEEIFYESFAESTGYTTNENDNFSGSAGSGTIQADNNGWEFTNGHGAGESAKFGASKNAGSATTPSITVENGKEYTLTFKAAPWASDESTMNITVVGGNISGVSSANMTTGQWNDYEATITATSAALTITFEASNNRFFLDEVRITAPAEAADAPTLTLSASGYASYCCEYPLDFSNIDKNTFKAWYVSNVDMDKGDVTFTEITGSIKGGEAFFLYGTPNAECQLTFANSCETTLQGNQLEGTLAPTYVENDDLIQNYGLSGGSFVKMGNGIVKAHKAYLPVLKVEGETGARLNISFESGEATGINNTLEITNNGEVYNLQGQKVSDSYKGIVIRNGKKFMVK